eukprot:scaffold8722_cov105-Skeletonema_dohrnii-CCMP3373.AAC.3
MIMCARCWLFLRVMREQRSRATLQRRADEYNFMILQMDSQRCKASKGPVTVDFRSKYTNGAEPV